MILTHLPTIYQRCTGFFEELWTPLSRREDDARRERILLILLTLLSVLSILFSLSVFSLTLILHSSRRGISTSLSIIISLIFIGGLLLTKKGYWKFIRLLLLGTFIIPTLYSLARWSTLLPIPLLALSLIILMVGILINIKAAVKMVVLVGSYLGIIIFLHQKSILAVDIGWMQDTVLYPNYTFEIISILMCIVGVMALGFTEIESSLRRARRSEGLLRKEKINLEAKVLERTKDLEELQMSKLKQIEHLVDIGKISAGLFHDLINPLTALSLHINNIPTNQIESEEIKSYVNQAVKATNRLTKLTKQIKDELKQQSQPQRINIPKAIQQALDIVQYQANQANINLEFVRPQASYAYCDPIRFQRAIVNILINGLEVLVGRQNPKIRVSLTQESDLSVLKIKDNGPGITPELLPHLFEQFFTTKKGNHGLGLSIAQDLLQKELKASITVESILGQGTCFIITWKN